MVWYTNEHMSTNDTSTWQLISQLSFIDSCIDEMLQNLEENLENLKTAKERHGSINDVTVSRVIKVYTDQLMALRGAYKRSLGPLFLELTADLIVQQQ